MPQRTLLASARAPLAAFVALGLMWGTFAALVPDLKAALALSDPAFGRLLLATSSAALAGMLAAPRAAARLGRGALPVFVVALAAAFAALPHAPGVAAFALALAAIGASAGALDVTMNIHVSAIEAARGRHLMNFAHGSYSLGYAVGAILTGLARGAGGAPGPILAWTAAVALVLAAVATGRRAAPAGSGEAAAGG
ncbi:MAG: MFS transporter, partial [Rhodobacteraceae bacterium]|nr:MFS transporter [Paracoccaceae bacterium]